MLPAEIAETPQPNLFIWICRNEYYHRNMFLPQNPMPGADQPGAGLNSPPRNRRRLPPATSGSVHVPTVRLTAVGGGSIEEQMILPSTPFDTPQGSPRAHTGTSASRSPQGARWGDPDPLAPLRPHWHNHVSGTGVANPRVAEAFPPVPLQEVPFLILPAVTGIARPVVQSTAPAPGSPTSPASMETADSQETAARPGAGDPVKIGDFRGRGGSARHMSPGPMPTAQAAPTDATAPAESPFSGWQAARPHASGNPVGSGRAFAQLGGAHAWRTSAAIPFPSTPGTVSAPRPARPAAASPAAPVEPRTPPGPSTPPPRSPAKPTAAAEEFAIRDAADQLDEARARIALGLSPAGAAPGTSPLPDGADRSPLTSPLRSGRSAPQAGVASTYPLYGAAAGRDAAAAEPGAPPASPSKHELAALESSDLRVVRSQARVFYFRWKQVRRGKHFRGALGLCCRS